MPINAGFEYSNAEKEYIAAETNEEKLIALEKMLRTAPDHKSSQKFRGELKLKIKKLKEKLNKEKQKAKARGKQQQGIRKTDMQAIIIGLTNTGKSSILKALTNKDVKIASYGFTTQVPEIGTMNHKGCQIQLVDMPPIGNENFDKSIVNSADTILVVIEKLHELPELKEMLSKIKAKQILVFNKSDLYDGNTKRKIRETLRSKRYNFVITSTKTNEGLDELKEKIFKSFKKIRVYTKKPNKKEHEPEAMILNPKSTIKDAARKALHGKAHEVKQAKIWGPSSKFSGQQVGLKHTLKDKDIVEFITK